LIRKKRVFLFSEYKRGRKDWEKIPIPLSKKDLKGFSYSVIHESAKESIKGNRGV